MMEIAEIYLERGKVKKIKLEKKIKFRCKRCGIFCCGLGAPNLTLTELQIFRERWGEKLSKYIEPREAKSGYASLSGFGFRSSPACVFLERNNTGNNSKCTIYKERPLLCRLYPFYFKRKGKTIAITLLPCNGIGAGRVITEKFFARLLKLCGEVLGIFEN